MSDLIERLQSHMGKADMGEVLADCRLAATAIESLRAENARLTEERDALVEDHRKLALFHASGGQDVAWADVDGIVARALAKVKGGTDAR